MNLPKRWPRSTQDLSEHIAVVEAADELSLPTTLFWRWIAQREIHALKLGMRQVHVRRDDLNALLRAKVQAGELPPR